MNRISLCIAEAQVMFTHSPGWVKKFSKRVFEYFIDIPWRFKSRRDRRCTFGNALIAPMFMSLKDRDIPLWLNTSAKKILVEDDRVAGMEVEKDGEILCIKASKGVLLAAGGFDNNQELRGKYLPDPSRAEWSCGNPYATGDTIDMGLEIGAGLELMDEGWWGPTVVVPGEERARILVIEKSLPGGMFVNKKGERFVNESSAYDSVVKAIYAHHTKESPCVPAYMIFDARFRKKYPIGPLLPGAQVPDFLLSGELKRNFYKKADTLEELAQITGVDKEGLLSTVNKMNAYAHTGKDLDFDRGANTFDQFYGDKSVTPNPCLAPIDKPPFYAIEIFPGDLGTKGGLKVDEKARVLKEDGSLIAGLYATGNCSSPVFGRCYPGAGSTLGPTTTFGHIAANDAIG